MDLILSAILITAFSSSASGGCWLKLSLKRDGDSRFHEDLRNNFLIRLFHWNKNQSAFFSFFPSSYHLPGTATEGCQSPQYLEYGKSGVIQCIFHPDFHGVLWYDSTDTDLDVPFLKLIDSVKSGPGYHSDEYDVYSNGSLIIKNVSSTHDQTFTALEFVSATDDPVRFDVDVTTIGM